MRCEKCGHENPEHVTYCGKCGEWARGSMLSPQSSAKGDVSPPGSSDSVPMLQSQIRKDPAKLPLFYVAAIAALIGAILIIAALALQISYFELIIDEFGNREFPRDSSDWELRTYIAKASIYFQLAGHIFVVLSILLLVQGCMARQKLSADVAGRLPIPLSHVRTLVVLALISVTITFGLHLFLYEVPLDLDYELSLRLTCLPNATYAIAWVCISLALFLVARRMNTGIQK